MLNLKYFLANTKVLLIKYIQFSLCNNIGIFFILLFTAQSCQWPYFELASGVKASQR